MDAQAYLEVLPLRACDGLFLWYPRGVRFLKNFPSVKVAIFHMFSLEFLVPVGCQQMVFKNIIWLVVWNIFHFSIYWE